MAPGACAWVIHDPLDPLDEYPLRRAGAERGLLSACASAKHGRTRTCEPLRLVLERLVAHGGHSCGDHAESEGPPTHGGCKAATPGNHNTTLCKSCAS